MKKLLLLILPFLLSGCYNYRELNDIAITSAIGVSKNNDNYVLTIQVINTLKVEERGDQPQFIIYKQEGKSLQEAFRKVVLESPKRLFVNHNLLLIIDENLAKEGIQDILDIFARDTEFRKQFLVVVSRNTNDEDILETQTPLEILNAKSILDSIDADLNYLGVSKLMTLELLLENYINDKDEISIPSIRMTSNGDTGEKDDNLKNTDTEARIFLDTLAVFKEDKLIGYLDYDESIAVNYINNEIKNSIISYECESNKYAAIEIIKNETKISPVKNKPLFEISIKANGNINEIHCNIDLSKESEIKKLEQEVENVLKENIVNTLNVIKNDYNSDIFGFSEILYKSNPKYFYKLKEETNDNILSVLDFDVKVDIGLLAKGNLVQVITNEKQNQ